MGKSDFFFVASLPKAGTTAPVSWMIDALNLPRALKEPGFLYNCPDSVSCFRDDRLSKRRVKFGSLPSDLKQVLDGSPHYLHASHFPKFEEAIHRLRSDEHIVKVVVVLKDPIDSVISHFNHHERDDAEPLETREALMPSGYAERLRDIPDLWTGYDYLGDSKFAESVHAPFRLLSYSHAGGGGKRRRAKTRRSTATTPRTSRAGCRRASRRSTSRPPHASSILRPTTSRTGTASTATISTPR